jgi:hypothetical protein
MAGAGGNPNDNLKARYLCSCKGSYTKNYVEEFDGDIFKCDWGNDNCPVLQEYREKRNL